MKRTALRKKGKSKSSILQKECDRLLQLVNKATHSECEACGGPNQVGHHWIEKSRSNFLRYDLERNIIPLCNSCHSKIHNIFGNNIMGGLNVAEAIIEKRGRAWKETLERERAKTIKTDVAHYESVRSELAGILEEFRTF